MSRSGFQLIYATILCTGWWLMVESSHEWALLVLGGVTIGLVMQVITG